MNTFQRRNSMINEQQLLIDILNTMYNDNLRQITNLTNSNMEIRNLIIQILNTNHLHRRNNIGDNNIYRNNNSRNNFRDNSRLNENVGSFNLNNLYHNHDNTIQQIRLPINRNSRNINLNNNNEYARILQNFFDPVEVYPTQTQIEAATRRVRYCEILSPKNTCCPISLNSFNDNDMVTVIRHCGHIFNTDDLHTWFRSHYSCPVCRYDIREDNSNASSVFSSENQTIHTNTSPQQSLHNNQTEESSITSVERTNNSTFGSNMFEEFVNNYITEHAQEMVIFLSLTDVSGNNNVSGQLRNLTQHFVNEYVNENGPEVLNSFIFTDASGNNDI